MPAYSSFPFNYFLDLLFDLSDKSLTDPLCSMTLLAISSSGCFFFFLAIDFVCFFSSVLYSSIFKSASFLISSILYSLTSSPDCLIWLWIRSLNSLSLLKWSSISIICHSLCCFRAFLLYCYYSSYNFLSFALSSLSYSSFCLKSYSYY